MDLCFELEQGQVSARAIFARSLFALRSAGVVVFLSAVSALNNLYTDFNNNERLTNWVQSAGDPCGNNWLGVICEGSFVTSM